MKTFIHLKDCLRLALAAITLLSTGRVAGQTPTPFNGFPFGLPATIECEQFDVGGPGYGYHDTTLGNSGGKFRKTNVGVDSASAVDVDIFRCDVYGGTRGYCVGNTIQGEWLQYSITNSEAATYRIKVVARIAPTGQYATPFHLEVDGVNVTGTMTLPFSTYAWQTVYGLANITNGSHALRLVIDPGGPTPDYGLFDSITIYKVPPEITNPANQVTANLVSGTSLQTAKNNAAELQAALNRLPVTGGTVILPSGRYSICQQNPKETIPSAGGPARPPLVAAVPQLSAIRGNNVNEWRGFQFTVGSTPITVTALGRWVLSGNNREHVIKLVDQYGNDVQYGSVTLNTANQPAGQFAYKDLDASVTLLANTPYALMSQETSGGDYWHHYSGTEVILSGAATNAYPASAISLPGTYAVVSGSPGRSYGPVSLRYQAHAAKPGNNYAALLSTNKVTIQGTGTSPNGTTLVAFNRDTTIFYIGSGDYGFPTGSLVVSNILLQNISFEGNPTIDYTGNYNPNGIVIEDLEETAIGALVVFGGYSDMSSATNFTFSKNLVVQNCTFYNPPSSGISLLWTKDVLITNCTFSYFNGIAPSLAKTLGAWCGIVGQDPPVENVAVLNNVFNGNASMQSPSNYSADGLVWLPNGGKFAVESCVMTNYGLEAVQLNAGPYTVVGNTFKTISDNISSCALNTFHNTTNQFLSSPRSIYSAYCFANNTVNGGGGGIFGNGLTNTTGPYDLIVSANEFDLPSLIAPNRSLGVGMTYVQAVTVAGNKALQLDCAIQYCNFLDGYPTTGSTFELLVLGNDFAKAVYDTFVLQDPGNKMRRAQFIANKLGFKWEDHIHLELTNVVVPPINIVRGNQFWYGGTNAVCSPIFNVTGQGTGPVNIETKSLGVKFQMGTGNGYATYVGRRKISGNGLWHNVKLVDAAGNNLNNISINMSGQPDGEFAYAQLPGTFGITLAAGTPYYLVSEELSGADSWYWQLMVSGNDCTAQAAVRGNLNPPYAFNEITGSYCHVPVNLHYFKIVPQVGTAWSANAGGGLGYNWNNQYIINNPSEFADSTFSLY